jgi:hypothetical protein
MPRLRVGHWPARWPIRWLLLACVGVAFVADLGLFLARPSLADCARLGIGWECVAVSGYSTEGLPFAIDAGVIKAKADLHSAGARLGGAGLALVHGEFLPVLAPALAGAATFLIAAVQFVWWFLVFTVTVNLLIAVPVLAAAAWCFVLLVTAFFRETLPEEPDNVDFQPYGDARAATIEEADRAARGSGGGAPPPMFKD